MLNYIVVLLLLAGVVGCGNDNAVKSTGTVSSEDWVRGDRDAPISVIVYSDLECPFCKAFHATLQSLLREYPGTINLVFRHYPLTALFPKSAKEAEASECAGELGGNDKFWAFIDGVFAVTPSNNGLDPEELAKIAGSIGLDEEKFTACLSSGKHTQKIQDAINEAVAAGATGTPYTVIVSGNQQKIVTGAVPYEDLWVVVDSFFKN